MIFLGCAAPPGRVTHAWESLSAGRVAIPWTAVLPAGQLAVAGTARVAADCNDRA